jgi:hypothetical protein
METISVETIDAALERAALWDSSVRDYSGRHMDGSYCAGVTFTGTSELCLFFVALAFELGEDEAQYLAKRTRTDGMGHGEIAYWPGVALEGRPHEDEDEDLVP